MLHYLLTLLWYCWFFVLNTHLGALFESASHRSWQFRLRVVSATQHMKAKWGMSPSILPAALRPDLCHLPDSCVFHFPAVPP